MAIASPWQRRRWSDMGLPDQLEFEPVGYYRQINKYVVKNGVTFLNDFIESSQDTVFGLSADILLEAIEIGLRKRSDRGPDRGISSKHAIDNGFFDQKK
jgi:hypothetical protein